ncbi:MBL fold metallo-hydrolase [Aeromonas dhakensis]|uniref:MBL fold metallo-hydrolase n=1 Tax=Aeromonas dhakensis TaxID=196024 RepID=UPI0039862B75
MDLNSLIMVFLVYLHHLVVTDSSICRLVRCLLPIYSSAHRQASRHEPRQRDEQDGQFQLLQSDPDRVRHRQGGVPEHKVKELDWWQQTRIGGVEFIATPAQHFSGRGLGDGNQTLWASWVIRGEGTNLFFSGDSGYFDGFKEIGKRFGPFDVTFLETGAYDKRWEYVHMLPAQTAQAFHDLRGQWLYPIHNGTFDLAMHAWDDPLEQRDQVISLRTKSCLRQLIEQVDRSKQHRQSCYIIDQRCDMLPITPDVVVGVCHQLLRSKVAFHEVKLSSKTQNLQVL